MGVKPSEVRFVYFAQCGKDGPIKIGVSGHPLARVADIQGGNPETVTLLATIVGSALDERRIHRQFESTRIRGEWFAASPELIAFIAALASPAPKPKPRRGGSGRRIVLSQPNSDSIQVRMISAAMETRGVSILDLSRLAGVHPTLISRYLSPRPDRRVRVGKKHAMSIATALGLDAIQLLYADDLKVAA